jgi:hypothetical protein
MLAVLRALWAVVRALADVVVAGLRAIPCLFELHHWTLDRLDRLYCIRCGLERPARY